MDKREIYKKVEVFGGFENQKQYYADDFQAVDENSGQIYDKEGWFSMGKVIQSAFPDIKNVVDEIKDDGDNLLITSHWVGTFTNPFDLTALGMGMVPASGKKLVFPSAKVRYSFKGDQIAHVVVLNTGPEAGFGGILKTLGVSMTQ
jgi:hypothetical protein